MNVIMKKIGELSPYENNPRYNDTAAEKVAESIKNFGFRVPILIDEKNTIVSGHSRYKASQLLELQEVPCIVINDLSEKQIKAFRIADNKVAEEASWDFFSLADEMKDLKLGDLDLELTGFDGRELENILDLIGDDELDTPASSFTPTYNPSTSQSFVSETEVADTQKVVDAKFTPVSAPKHNVMICPHCGLEFETD
jgi:ParB-like chromosome segregation protein Spo0J